MKKVLKPIVTSVVALGLFSGTISTAIAEGRHHHHHRGRNIGIGLGVAAAAIAVGAAASSARASDGSRQCARWDYRCDNGERYACRQLARYC